jgi:hypothetical protein
MFTLRVAAKTGGAVTRTDQFAAKNKNGTNERADQERKQSELK